MFQKIKSFFTWKLPLEQEQEEDPFYGCDLSTLLTGFPIGSFNLIDVSKVISVWQVLSGDGTQIGIWLIENLGQHQHENLITYSQFFKGVNWETLKKELGEIIEIHSERGIQTVVKVEEITAPPFSARHFLDNEIEDVVNFQTSTVV